MKYFLWLYLANIINRIRWLGIVVARCSLLAIVIGHLVLAQHTKPEYYDLVEHYINVMWLYFGLSLVLVFVPSENFILNILALYKRDSFMRNSFVSKILRLIKYTIKHDLLQLPYSKSLYQKIINSKRMKWICIAMYLYDLYKGFSRALRDLWYIVIAYFGFVIATWAYVKLTGMQLYYYSIIATSIEWIFAIAGFLIFKIIFVPSFSVIKKIAVKLIVDIIRHKLGFNNLENKIDDKLAEYEKSGDHYA